MHNRESLLEKSLSAFDILLIVLTAFALCASFFFKLAWADNMLIILAFAGLFPVFLSAIESIFHRKISVDLLASIALVFSLISHEWFSAAFITLMLAFARLFDRITQARAKKTIQSLMKYHVESVHIKIHNTIKEIHIHDVKPGDEVVVDSGERVPVDGIVVSGEAEVNESSLTGESEIVPKKKGDRVYTSTINENGSLVVRVEKVGKDTTLSKMISLVEEASRSKNQAERVADRFTQWYIVASLVASFMMYLYGLSPRIILSVLLVVCADDIAVAVPLAFTAAIARAAKRGIIVKGSAAFEQLSRVKYIFTDKTGTLTRGKPKILELKNYTEKFSDIEILERFVMGASESRHNTSRAIMEYAGSKNIKIRTPDSLEEMTGQGILFIHKGERMVSGRLSYMERHKFKIPNHIKFDIDVEKDSGRGVVCLAINDEVVAFLAYHDELRPHAKEIIDETRFLGVRSWHMLTGDNERAAAEVAKELGIEHYHANLTPEKKVEFMKRFKSHMVHLGEDEHGIVAYIGDGVNDAAPLALADVSIAMGGIGADAAIEASDITIMKDHLDRVPEAMRIAKKSMRIMWGNFAIWALTNVIGLSLVGFGFIGPAGAATYNFLTDFIPIGNALRAGRK